jgi:hypothetical protein
MVACERRAAVGARCVGDECHAGVGASCCLPFSFLSFEILGVPYLMVGRGLLDRVIDGAGRDLI